MDKDYIDGEMRKLTKKDRQNMEISFGLNGGFTIWVTEFNPEIKRSVKHWVVDASTLKEEMMIRLGNDVPSQKITAIYDASENAIRIIRK